MTATLPTYRQESGRWLELFGALGLLPEKTGKSVMKEKHMLIDGYDA